MKQEVLKKDIAKSIEIISSKIASNTNFVKREILIKGNINCCILYMKGISDNKYIEEIILKPLLLHIESPMEKSNISAREIAKKYILSSDIEFESNIENLIYFISSGKCVILVDGSAEAIVCSAKSDAYRSIDESRSEKSVLGTRESFVENLDLNIAMIQRKIQNPNLKIEKYKIGNKTKTDVVLTYIEGVIDQQVLSEIKKRINEIKTPAMLTTGILEQLIEKKTFSIFPQCKNTERSDKVVFDLLEGKAALFVAETPAALVVPAVFIEFFQSIEDYSERTILSNFSRLMRFIALVTVLILEPIYLVLLSYNPGLLPYKLILVIISSRQGIPLPPILEILAMDIAIEILREGGLRLPSPVGTTLAIVGGIVIGDAAVSAHLVSNMTLFIVAITAVSTFLIPSYEMTLSIRFLRFPLIILAQAFGFLGLLAGLFMLIVIIIDLESFGIPYFSPMAPQRIKDDLRDTMVRAPLKESLKEAVTFKLSLRRKK